MNGPDAGIADISSDAGGGSAHGTDPAAAIARSREDVVVGNEIVRHRLATRIVHWTTATFFFAALVSGLPVWSPIFGWMANLFGGLAVCRWLHPFLGIAFFAATFVMFVLWVREMVLEPGEWGWVGPKLFRYLRFEGTDPDVGKYNGGQKVFFWTAALGALGLLASGVVMWYPEEFSQTLRECAIVLHDVTFVLFAVAIVFHVYLGTAAEPGTFGSMTRGTVTKEWARLHHPRWAREVTGASEKPR
jgi:formate dehydrogenase subunit gamma